MCVWTWYDWPRVLCRDFVEDWNSSTFRRQIWHRMSLWSLFVTKLSPFLFDISSFLSLFFSLTVPLLHLSIHCSFMSPSLCLLSHAVSVLLCVVLYVFVFRPCSKPFICLAFYLCWFSVSPHKHLTKATLSPFYLWQTLKSLSLFYLFLTLRVKQKYPNQQGCFFPFLFQSAYSKRTSKRSEHLSIALLNHSLQQLLSRQQNKVSYFKKAVSVWGFVWNCWSVWVFTGDYTFVIIWHVWTRRLIIFQHPSVCVCVCVIQ